jgi:dolichol-phosphate mannosyltransferase
MRTLVVVPTYNEVATIEAVCRQVRAAATDVEVLVVDDASPDGTADVAEKLDGDLGGIHVLRRRAKEGLGHAYLAGFGWGLARDFDALVEMDADGQHDPAMVPQLVAGLDTADLVIGSRYVPGGSIPQWSTRRRLLSRIGNRYSAWILDVPVRDMTSGFRAYRSDLLRRLPLDGIYAGGYGFQVEMAYRSVLAGATIVEVPIRFADRQEGASKMSTRITVEALGLVTAMGVVRRVPVLRAVRPRGDVASLAAGRAAPRP